MIARPSFEFSEFASIRFAVGVVSHYNSNPRPSAIFANALMRP